MFSSKILNVLLTGLGLIVALGLIDNFIFRPWHTTWGATAEEARMPLPGDELVPEPKGLVTHGITINTRLRSVRRQGNALVATLGSDYGERTEERHVDQVVVEHGTLPVTDLYEALKPVSVNLGEVDYPALLAGRPQELVRHAAGRFRLFRVGDAVAGRNIHAAIYDSLRLCKNF